MIKKKMAAHDPGELYWFGITTLIILQLYTCTYMLIISMQLYLQPGASPAVPLMAALEYPAVVGGAPVPLTVHARETAVPIGTPFAVS